MATQLTVDNPDSVENKKVPDNGQIYLGRDWAGQEVQVILKRIDEQEDQ